MKNNIADREIREKMDSLSTLQGGVVFGKENAWEKLQQRLDQKPVSKRIGWYRLAAAAMLLLVVSIAVVMYRQPDINAVVKKESAPVTTPVENNHAIQQAATITEKQVATSAETLMIKTSMDYRRPETPIDNTSSPTNIQIVNTAPVPELPSPPAPEPPKIAAPVAAITPRKTMRVVHINELANENFEANLVDVSTENNKPLALTLSKMPVVHINDVMKMETEEGMFQFEMSRPSYVMSLMKPFYAQRNAAYPYLGPVARNNSLKIVIRSPF